MVSLGELLLELGKKKLTIRLLHEAIETGGATAAALLLSAKAHQQLGELGQAVSLARSAEMLEPQNVEVLRFLAECYVRQGRHEEELEYLRKMEQLGTPAPGLALLIAAATAAAGRKEEALQLYFKLDLEMPDDAGERPRVLSAIADIALQLGKLDVSQRYTEKELELPDRDQSEAHMRLGHISLLRGDWKSSISHYTSFINAFVQHHGGEPAAALARLKQSWQTLDAQRSMVNGQRSMLNGQRSMEPDLLLIHDILQASADGSL